MSLKPIKNHKDYSKALAEIKTLLAKNPSPGSPIADQIEILAILTEKYEEEKILLPMPNPIDAIRYRMKQYGMNVTKLGTFLGSLSRASDVLCRRRRLSLKMIRVLNKELHIPLKVLLQGTSLLTDSKPSKSKK